MTEAVINHEKKMCDGQTTVKIKRMARSSRVRHLFIWRLSLFYCYWAEKGKNHNVLKLAESNPFLHTHAHTHRVVLFLGYVPYPKTLSLSFMFICFSCTRVLLSLLWSCVYFHDRRPSRVDFIMCVWNPFHLKSVSLSFHFKWHFGALKTFYWSRSRSSLASLILL